MSGGSEGVWFSLSRFLPCSWSSYCFRKCPKCCIGLDTRIKHMMDQVENLEDVLDRWLERHTASR